MNKDILLLGANAPDMEVLRTRLVRIGYRVVPAKTPEQAHTFLRVAGTRIGAVIVPSEMPVMNLRAALDFMRRLSPAVPLTFLGAGREPGPRVASGPSGGHQLPIFDPLDPHAAVPGEPGARDRATDASPPHHVARAADWPVLVKSGVRQKEGRIYSVSASGAYRDRAAVDGEGEGRAAPLHSRRRLRDGVRPRRDDERARQRHEAQSAVRHGRSLRPGERARLGRTAHLRRRAKPRALSLITRARPSSCSRATGQRSRGA
jgi:CheY-like chemotaxis protein